MLKKFLIGLIVIVAILALLPFALSDEWSASSKITVNAAPADIYPDIAALETWMEWSPWNKKRDPNCEHEFPEPKMGTGSKWIWNGTEPPEGLGKGWMEITKASEAEGVEYTLNFEGFPPMHSAIKLTPTDDGTEISWDSSGTLGGDFLFKYLNALGFMESAMVEEYDAGLGKLKERAEARAQKSGKPVEASGKK